MCVAFCSVDSSANPSSIYSLIMSNWALLITVYESGDDQFYIPDNSMAFHTGKVQVHSDVVVVLYN